MGTREGIIIDMPNAGPGDAGARLPDARTVDALIPMVLRSAGPTALLREPRLEIAVNATGEIVARFVAGPQTSAVR